MPTLDQCHALGRCSCGDTTLVADDRARAGAVRDRDDAVGDGGDDT